MTDKLDNAAAKALDKIVSGIDGMTVKLSALADKYGPEVVDSGLWVVRVNGIKGIIAGFCLLAVSYVLSRLASRCWRKDPEEYGTFDREDWKFAGSFVFVACALFFAGALWFLFDPWVWVSVFEPKLWIAKKIMGL